MPDLRKQNSAHLPDHTLFLDFTMPLLKLISLLLICGLLLSRVQADLIPVPAPPALSASGYILLDYNSNKVLVENNANERVAPASITKLMTAYLVYKSLAQAQIHLDDEVPISEKAWRMEGSRMFIEVGKRVKLDDLLMGMIVQSGNDASVSLAEHVAGSEEAFAQMMNAQAEAMGLTNTHYVNATGLADPEHYSTAHDIALLAQRLIRDFPDQYYRDSEHSYTYNGITQHNRNKLLWRDPSVDGLKTGYTEEAGYCLASSAQRDGMRLISVVMGTPSANARVTQSQSLLNYGFRFFETRKLYAAGEPLASPRIWKGQSEQLPLGLTDDFYITIPRGQYTNLDAIMEVNPTIDAPAAKGKTYGDITVSLNDQEVGKEPLVALQSVEEGGMWRQTVDTVLLWFE